MIATIEATPNQQLLDAYDNYTNAGLAVVPLNGKTPKVKSWQKKTFSLDDFTAAIATYDDPGLGVRLGPDSGIIDLEYDTPEQLEAIRAIVGDDLLETCPAFESTKGKHFLFAWDDRLEATNAANLNIPCGDGDTLIVRLGAADKGSQSAFPPSPGKSWLAYQRKSYMRKHLSEERIARLESIGFSFTRG